MSHWTAVIPLKPGPECKSRLATILSTDERRRLVETMAGLVIAALGAVEAVDEIAVIGPVAVPDWPVRLVPDYGRGLNTELDSVARTIRRNLLVIHADLPCIEPQEIADLLQAARDSGYAIAPDRHGQGTNALALRDVPARFGFAFGKGSFAAHRALLGTELRIIERVGLACDVDTPDDFKLAVSHGCLNHSSTV